MYNPGKSIRSLFEPFLPFTEQTIPEVECPLCSEQMEWKCSSSDYHCATCNKLYDMNELEYNNFAEMYLLKESFN